jgi:hypothetical protein
LRRATHSLDHLTWNGEVECEKPVRRFYFEDTVLIEDTWNPEFGRAGALVAPAAFTGRLETETREELNYAKKRLLANGDRAQ